MSMSIEQWLKTAVGRATDPDGVAGYQCVDTPKDYFEKVTGRSWRDGWPGAGNAQDMLDTANPKYWTVVRNDPDRPDQLPSRGDVVVWGGSSINPYGHIAVVLSANANGGVFIDQDGFQQRAMAVDSLGWDNPGTGLVSGWLRPKFGTVSKPKPTPKPEKDILKMNKEELRALIRSEMWGYRNAALEKDDAYALLRAARTFSVKASQTSDALLAEVKALRAEVAALKAGK